jgi:hypothetical protein
METVEIRSILRDIALLIRDPQKNGELTSLTVQIAGRDATHLTITSAISNPAKLSQFFSRLVTERLEWGAERRWESDQRDFALAAGVDRPGRLNLSATLRKRHSDPRAGKQRSQRDRRRCESAAGVLMRHSRASKKRHPGLTVTRS